MQLHHWTMDRAGELSQSYNRQIADLPYTYSQSSEGFRCGIQDDLGELYGFSRDKLHSEKLVVTEDSNGISGFVHLCAEDTEEDGHSLDTSAASSG